MMNPRAISNVIKYQLSDEHYIKLGWTIKPTTKLARKIVLYETKTTKSNLNWSKLITDTKYYSDNKTPFIIYHENNLSRTVFYPTGKIAIKMQKSQTNNYDVYMVFNPEGKDEVGVNQEHYEMIAAFDTLGNGLVINEENKIRLTFNQIGGICFDKRVGMVPVAWTWSKFNVKPIMVAVYMEAATARLEKVLQKNVRLPSKSSADKNTSKSVTGTQKNFSRENIFGRDVDKKIIGKNDKLMPIKTICLKINNFISLRIVDRRNINLKFFAGSRNVRIELGFDVNFKKPLEFLLDDPSWGPKGFLRCRFQDEFTNNWINSKSNLFELFQESPPLYIQ